ncbi:uncharacterized protein MELLADRAFT_72911 [Melampsora larici-populina 98AG31]|uniref:Secreted protein n=1 Tax=Melampsora larici-populina (strain 98AG31 / pathotype 3-4-7) TaxID=747676 RepID=F4S0M4_MELLP|nr:uncharacterized protein MELLADRAFT_72911 [Melampsora larici-populina 98AG31]EGG01791.1 secreted protein [Melampsora larici-populina 98AG31]
MSASQKKNLSTLAFAVVLLLIAQVKSENTTKWKVCSAQYIKATIGADSKFYPTGGKTGSGSATCSLGQSATSQGTLVVHAKPDFDLGVKPYCVSSNADCVAVDEPVTRQPEKVEKTSNKWKVCSAQYIKATIGADSKFYPTGGKTGSGSATCSPGQSATSPGTLVVHAKPDFDLGVKPYCVSSNANCVAVDEPVTRQPEKVEKTSNKWKVCSGQYIKATIGADSKFYPTGGKTGSGSATCSLGQSATSPGTLVVHAKPDFDLGVKPYCVSSNADCVAVDEPVTRQPEKASSVKSS